MRDSFVFYRSFAEAISCLPDEDRLQMMDGLIEYALNETEPEFDGMAKGMFILIKPQIDANNNRYENGKKGGRPANKSLGGFENQTKTKPKPNHNQTITKPKPNVNENVNVNENENVNASDVADVWSLSRSVLSYLNEQAGATYKTDDAASVRLITELFKAGYTEEQMKAVVDKKVDNWLGDPKVEQYLRPRTLFGPKFETYLHEPDSARRQKQADEQKRKDRAARNGRRLEEAEKELAGIREQIAALPSVRDNPGAFERRSRLKDNEAILETQIARIKQG